MRAAQTNTVTTNLRDAVRPAARRAFTLLRGLCNRPVNGLLADLRPNARSNRVPPWGNCALLVGALRTAACILTPWRGHHILAAVGGRSPRRWAAPTVYDELRKLAARMAPEAPDHTLQPTALVHEAYLRLVGHNLRQPWNGRGHFFAAAAEAMRRILVDHAREQRCEKRGGKLQRLEIDAIALATMVTPDQLLAIDDALAKLLRDDPTAGQIVQLRYFGGLTVEEAGEALGLATATAYRHWNYARVWLHSELLERSDW